MNRNRPRDNRIMDRGGRNNYGIGGDGLLGEGPGPSPGGAGPMMGGNPLGIRDSQLALAQSLIQQQQLVNAGFGGATGGDFGSLGALAGGMHFLQQQQQMRAPPMVGGMGAMLNDRKRSGGQLKRENDGKRGRRDSWGRGERDRSYGNSSRSGQDRDRNRSSRWESDKEKKRHGEDYDPAEPTEDDDEGGNKGNDSSNLYCHVCSVSVYDEESFQRHLNGLKHKARMESIASVHQMRSTQLKSRMKAEEHLRNIERKGGRDPDYFCKICNNDLAIPWEKHRYSNIHKQRLLQVRKGCGWCKVHDFSNFTEVLEHRETEEHKKNSDLYGKKEEDKEHHSSKDGKERERTISSSERSKSDERRDEAEEEEEEDLTIPEYSAETPVGLDYVIPVTGYFCKLCHKFYNKKSAKATHCQTMPHYGKFKEAMEVKIAAREKKKEEERLRKEKEAEEAMEEGGGEEMKDGEEEQNDNDDGKKEDSGDEDGDHDNDEDKEAMEDEEHDDGILDEDIGEEDDDEDQIDNDQDLSGSIGADDGLMALGDDVSTVNTTAGNDTMESSSFMYVPGDTAQTLQRQEKSMQSTAKKDKESACELQDDVEPIEAADPPKVETDAEDDALADVVTSELSQTSLNPEEGDDDLDLSVPEDNPAMTTSTPVVAEEAPAVTPPPATATKGKGTARRGRGRGRSKK